MLAIGAAGILIAAAPIQAQTTLYSESFEGAHGWTLNVSSGTNGADNNIWVVSDAEGGVSAGSCAVPLNGNKTLHVTIAASPGAGAAYDAGGLCGIVACPLTDRRSESPAFSTIGQSNITLSFDYIAYGDALSDNGSVWYDAGAGWTQLTASLKTSSFCGNGQPSINAARWASHTVALPAAAENKASVKIGFRWVNNDDGVGTDPSVAVDNISVVATPPAASPTPSTTATLPPPTPTATIAPPSPTTTVAAPVGDCPSTPASGCRVGKHGALIVRNSRTSSEGEVEWRFQKGPILSASDFGDPRTTSSYVMCVYDDEVLVGETRVEPSASLWHRVGNERGYHYKNKSARAGEVSSLRLDGRVEGGSLVAVEANLLITPASDQTIFNARTEVLFQLLVSSGGCFESSFSGNSIRWNEARRVRGLF